MKKRKLGIIGGSGLYKMEGFEKTKWKKINTPWGKPSDEILIAEFDKEILKTLKIIPINEAKSILEHTLVKPISPLDLSESDILEAQKNRYSDTNLKENIRH